MSLLLADTSGAMYGPAAAFSAAIVLMHIAVRYIAIGYILIALTSVRVRRIEKPWVIASASAWVIYAVVYVAAAGTKVLPALIGLSDTLWPVYPTIAAAIASSLLGVKLFINQHKSHS